MICDKCGGEFKSGFAMHYKFCKGDKRPPNMKTETNDDKTAGNKSVTSQAAEQVAAAPAESQKEQEPEQQPQTEQKSKSWILEICIAVIAILLAAFWIFHYFLMPPKQDEEEQKDE